MTREEKVEALRDELTDALFADPVVEMEKIDVILDKLNELEPLQEFDVEEGLRKFKEKYRDLYERNCAP